MPFNPASSSWLSFLDWEKCRYRFRAPTEKGKRFTDIVTKRPVYATVQTTSQLMRGNIHVRRDQRIKDELALDDKFIAITDVSILDEDGQDLMFQAPFLAVNRAHIIWVLPEQKQSSEETA